MQAKASAMLCTVPHCATAFALRPDAAAMLASARFGEAPAPAPTMPPCVHLGPDATTLYRGPRITGSRLTSVDAMLYRSRRLRNIAVDVAYAGSSARVYLSRAERVEPGTIAAGATFTAGTYDPPTNTIGWFPGYIDYGVDHAGQNAVQMLFHEFDHGWYSETTASSSVMSPTMSAVIGAVTYRWTLYRRERGKTILNSIGWNGYQHMLIHDDLVADFGSDKTGALFEALQAADDPPAHLSEIARQFEDTRPWFPAASLFQRGRPAAPPMSGEISCFRSVRPQHHARENLRPQLPQVDATLGGGRRAPHLRRESARSKGSRRAR